MSSSGSSEAYNVLRGEITTLRDHVETALSDRVIAGVERTLDQNIAAVEFWSGYFEFAASAMEAGRLGETIRALRQTTVALFGRKAAAPLEPFAPDDSFAAATEALAGARASAVAAPQRAR